MLTGGDVEPGDNVFWDVVKVLHQCSERVAVRRDLCKGREGRREERREEGRGRGQARSK